MAVAVAPHLGLMCVAKKSRRCDRMVTLELCEQSYWVIDQVRNLRAQGKTLGTRRLDATWGAIA